MEARILAWRHSVRSALGLRTIAPWWQRRAAGQKRVQMIVAFNLAVVAVGLPFFWNREVDRRAAARAKARADRVAALPTSDAAAERLAIQLLVNERRAARGLPPYPYAPEVAHTEEVRDLFAAAERLHREQQAAERLVAAVHDHYRSVYGGSAAPLA